MTPMLAGQQLVLEECQRILQNPRSSCIGVWTSTIKSCSHTRQRASGEKQKLLHHEWPLNTSTRLPSGALAKSIDSISLSLMEGSTS